MTTAISGDSFQFTRGEALGGDAFVPTLFENGFAEDPAAMAELPGVLELFDAGIIRIENDVWVIDEAADYLT